MRMLFMVNCQLGVTCQRLPSKCEGVRLRSDSSMTSTVVHDTDSTLSYITHFSRGQGRGAAISVGEKVKEKIEGFGGEKRDKIR